MKMKKIKLKMKKKKLPCQNRYEIIELYNNRIKKCCLAKYKNVFIYIYILIFFFLFLLIILYVFYKNSKSFEQMMEVQNQHLIGLEFNSTANDTNMANIANISNISNETNITNADNITNISNETVTNNTKDFFEPINKRDDISNQTNQPDDINKPKDDSLKKTK